VGHWANGGPAREPSSRHGVCGGGARLSAPALHIGRRLFLCFSTSSQQVHGCAVPVLPGFLSLVPLLVKLEHGRVSWEPIELTMRYEAP
jgi:hypothetical protein